MRGCAGTARPRVRSSVESRAGPGDHHCGTQTPCCPSDVRRALIAGEPAWTAQPRAGSDDTLCRPEVRSSVGMTFLSRCRGVSSVITMVAGGILCVGAQDPLDHWVGTALNLVQVRAFITAAVAAAPVGALVVVLCLLAGGSQLGRPVGDISSSSGLERRRCFASSSRQRAKAPCIDDIGRGRLFQTCSLGGGFSRQAPRHCSARTGWPSCSQGLDLR